jgi:hypothetical protein
MMLAHTGLVVIHVFFWSHANLCMILAGAVALVLNWSAGPRRLKRLWWIGLLLLFGIVSVWWLDSIYSGWLFIGFGAVPLVCGLGALVGWLTRRAAASPNGGPAGSLNNSEASSGPPSVS